MPPKDTEKNMNWSLIYGDEIVFSEPTSPLQVTSDDVAPSCSDKYASYRDCEEISCMIEDAEVNDNILKELLGNQVEDSHTYELYVRLPVRRHRKKRINKKWNKKYGIKTIESYLGTCELSEMFCDTGTGNKLQMTLHNTRKANYYEKIYNQNRHNRQN